jgi:hypothetical protein
LWYEACLIRRYVHVNRMKATADYQGETGREAQIRFTKEFYDVAEEWDP